MAHLPEIAIIESNTLICIGLKSVLEKIIPGCTIRVFHDFGELADDTPDMYSHYFISTQVYIDHNAFFFARKEKTIVLVGESQSGHQLMKQFLNVDQPEKALVRDILKLHQQGHPDGHPDFPSNVSKEFELTSREIEVLTLIAKGLINKEIAKKLHISLTTVITHRKNITEKLGIKSVSGLTIYAVMNRYVDAGSI